MQISFSKQEGRVPVTIMQLIGNLDASNYAEVIAKAQNFPSTLSNEWFSMSMITTWATGTAPCGRVVPDTGKDRKECTPEVSTESTA